MVIYVYPVEQELQSAGRDARRTLILWLAVAVWAALIFFFSAQPGLSTNLGKWDYLLRKTAHMTEFAVLCLLLWRALRIHLQPRREALALALAAALSLAYAASDEFHQTFVAGRTGKVTDVGYDLAGITILTAAVIWCRRRQAASSGNAAAP
jgi:VanZ family protein